MEILGLEPKITICKIAVLPVKLYPLYPLNKFLSKGLLYSYIFKWSTSWITSYTHILSTLSPNKLFIFNLIDLSNLFKQHRS